MPYTPLISEVPANRFLQTEIVGGLIDLGANLYYGDGGCPPYQLYEHEIGHVLGLGHTTYGTQQMSGSYPPDLQSGDLHGVQCIYDLVNCDAYP